MKYPKSKLPEIVQKKEDSFFVQNKNSEVIQRKKENEDWVNDMEGKKAVYYKTKEEAERRMETLKKRGKNEEYKIESFKIDSKTYWRVKIKGKKKESETPKKDEPKKIEPVKDEPVKDEPAKKETPPTTIDPVFALTFDDGPHSATLGKGGNRTENVLDVLKSEGIKAAFFIQTEAEDREGNKMRGNTTVGKQLVKRMFNDGHDVGVHTGSVVDHKLHTTSAKEGTLESELTSAKSFIKEQTGSDPTYVRPPTGAYDKDVTAIYGKVGLKNLMWDIDGDQGKNLTIDVLKSRLDSGLQQAKNNNWKPWVQKLSSKIVVLYHDIQKGTSTNIKALIDYIRKVVKDLGGGTAKFDKP